MNIKKNKKISTYTYKEGAHFSTIVLEAQTPNVKNIPIKNLFPF